MCTQQLNVYFSYEHVTNPYTNPTDVKCKIQIRRIRILAGSVTSLVKLLESSSYSNCGKGIQPKRLQCYRKKSPLFLLCQLSNNNPHSPLETPYLRLH